MEVITPSVYEVTQNLLLCFLHRELLHFCLYPAYPMIAQKHLAALTRLLSGGQANKGTLSEFVPTAHGLIDLDTHTNYLPPRPTR